MIKLPYKRRGIFKGLKNAVFQEDFLRRDSEKNHAH